MSSDICKSFRDNFRYGQTHDDELADQLTECCSSHLAKNSHIGSIDDVFNETNFTQVAVPIMQCQHDRVVALVSRTAQIDAVCQTVENWEDMKNDANLNLPQFLKNSDLVQTEFVTTCTKKMKARDKAAGSTGQKLDVTFDSVMDDIRLAMGPTGSGLWKTNLSKIGDFCEKEAKYNWGDQKNCCIDWVKDKIDLKNVTATSDFEFSLYHYLVTLNKGSYTSLKAQKNTRDQSLYHQCGLG